MTENLYIRQEQLQINTNYNVTVIGAGGVGTNVAIELAMTGIRNISIFDHDVLEESNRNRLPLCEGFIGKPKVDAVRAYIAGIRPDCNVIAVPDKLEGILLELQLRVSTAFIDCTDSYRTQLKLFTTCRSKDITYIRAGYDGLHMTVSSVVPSWGAIGDDTTTPEETGYRVDPSWRPVAEVVACLAVAKLEKFPNLEVSCNLDEIGVSVLKNTRAPRPTTRCRTRV